MKKRNQINNMLKFQLPRPGQDANLTKEVYNLLDVITYRLDHILDITVKENIDEEPEE